MIEELKPYSSHRATGVYWLPQVPAHWEIVRSKRVFAERTELARAGDVQLSATQAYGVIPQAEFERRVGRRVVRISMHLDKRRHVERGDFVISMRSFQGGLERAWASGAIRSSYVVLRPARELDLGYFTHLFKAQPYIKALQATGNFIRDGQDLTFGNFSRVDLPVPPRDEQHAIGRFLDHANRRIDQFIRSKKKLIALLNEQKQAIAHRAVTRGLDLGAKLKDSGAPWIPTLPAHWHVVRFKSRVGFQEGPGIMAADFRPRGVPLLRIAGLRKETASLDGCNHLDPSMVADRWTHFRVNAGDYLLSSSASTGKVVLATEAVASAIPYTGIIRLWPKGSDTHMPFVCHYLGSRPFQDQIDAAKSGVGIEHFGPTHLRRMVIAMPPLAEQVAISRHVAEATSALGPLIGQADREIELLREYHTRLVSDVVTGQLDVRAAAASLPDLDLEATPAEFEGEETAIDDIEAA